MNVREGEWKSCVATKLHCQVQNVMAERLSCSKSCRPRNKRHFIYGIACSMLYLPPPPPRTVPLSLAEALLLTQSQLLLTFIGWLFDCSSTSV